MKIIDGECGSATQFKFPQILDKNPKNTSRLCSSGKPSAITSVGNINNWKCYGINGGGKTANCSVDLPAEQEVKEYFNASEIIYNGLPDDYITFWSEAECPYSGKNYSYKAPNDYYVSAEYCPEKEIGIHGGCPTCVMSEVTLRKKTEVASNS